MNIPSSGGSQLALNRAQSTSQTQLDRLSSGNRINSAKDDAAGLAISSRLDAQVSSGIAARRNIFDGISRLQVEDGVLGSITEEVQRIRELKVQQNNGILSDSDKQALQQEIDDRVESIQFQAENTQFNGNEVFKSGELAFQVGPNQGQTVDIETQGLESEISTLQSSSLSLDDIDNVLGSLNERRSDVGAVSNRLESQAQTQELSNEQNQATNSRIRDTDVAEAISKKIASDIQQKVAISVQSQANLSNELVLKLL